VVTSTAAKTQEARQAQSDADKMSVLDRLKNKKPATDTFTLQLGDDEVELTYTAIGAGAYDKLVGKYPPTTEQRADGASFNLDTFAPALISAVCTDPVMTYKDAKEIWDSDEWSRGECMTLWRKAIELCNRGFDIPFTAPG